MLDGHSYGGLFSTWTMLTSPHLFSGYVIVSPSLWYHDRWLFDQKAAKRATPIRAYLTVGSMESDGRSMQNDLKRLAASLRGQPDIEVQHEVLDHETHNSVFPSAFSRGIRFVLKGR